MCLGCREILSDPVWACPSSGPIPVGTARSQAVREARPEQADRSDYRRRKRKQGLQSASAPRRADSTRSSGHCQAHQSGRIGLAFNAAHRRDQPVSVNKRSQRQTIRSLFGPREPEAGDRNLSRHSVPRSCRIARIRGDGVRAARRLGRTKGAITRFTAPAYWKFESIFLQR